MSRRRFIRTTGHGIIAAALPLSGCEVFRGVPNAAIAAWQPQANIDPRKQALSYAILAPNPHNRQPWLVDLTADNEIAVRIDTERLLPHTDPFGRQILIGTGAMLEILHIAAQSLGYQVSMKLFEKQPFGETIDKRIVARIRLDKAASPSASDSTRLFANVLKRRTVRETYDVNRPPDSTMIAWLEANRTAQVRMGLIGQEHSAFDTISAIAKAAWKIELTTPHTMMESIRLLRVGAAEIEQHRDGISISDPMLVLVNKLGMFDRSKPPAPDSSVMQGQIDEFNQQIDSTPAYFWLTSNNNSRTSQIEAGRAYVRAQLMATEMGMVMHPLSQALQEYPEMQAQFQSIHKTLARSGETVQMMCRIGYLPDGQTMPTPSPRRGLSAHLQA